MISDKKTNYLSSGQAVIEYILILLVVLVLLMSSLWRLSTAYRNYTINLFGNYFACLLETGELPSQAAGICASQFQKFDLNSGSQKATFGDTKGVQGGATSGTRPPSSSSNSAPYTRVGSETLGGPGFGGRAIRSTAGAGGSGSGGTGREGPKLIDLSSSYRGNRSIGRLDTPSGQFSVDLGEEYDGSGKKKKTGVAKKEGGTISNDIGSLKKGKFTVDTSTKSQKRNEDEGKEYSIGDLLRLFLIVAIIIALLMLIGGQLLQISKSLEKN